MNAFAQIALLGWLPLMLVVFALVPVRIAILVCSIGGWLLLPQLSFQLPGLPNYEKLNAISVSMLLGSVLFDPGGLARVRWSKWDLPMAVWIASAFAAAMANGTGAYDATASTTYRLLDWGVPYAIGRAYFASPRHARMLLWGIFLGGLCYVLPCLWEIRMSPTLHLRVYGDIQHSWAQTLRGEGYRPLVFTPHGLALSLWMAIATIAGVSLWRQRAVSNLFGVPLWLLVAAVGGTMVLCKSLGATILLAVGVAMLLLPYGRLLHGALLLLVPIYLWMRLTGVGGIYELLSSFASTLPPDRAVSLQFRLDNEAILIERGWQKPVFGWTPWSFLDPIADEWGELRLIVCDSMWIINFVCDGLVGLASMVAVQLLPGAKAVRARAHSRTVVHADDYSALGVIVTMFLVDTLVNAFTAPAYVLAIGALVGATRAQLAGQTAPARAGRQAADPRPHVALLRPRWTAPERR